MRHADWRWFLLHLCGSHKSRQAPGPEGWHTRSSNASRIHTALPLLRRKTVLLLVLLVCVCVFVYYLFICINFFLFQSSLIELSIEVNVLVLGHGVSSLGHRSWLEVAPKKVSQSHLAVYVWLLSGLACVLLTCVWLFPCVYTFVEVIVSMCVCVCLCTLWSASMGFSPRYLGLILDLRTLHVYCPIDIRGSTHLSKLFTFSTDTLKSERRFSQ